MKYIITFMIILLLIIFCAVNSSPKISWQKRELIIYKGDTLWSLSGRFCPNKIDRRWWVNEVKKINNTNGNIKEGQVLTILVTKIKDEE